MAKAHAAQRRQAAGPAYPLPEEIEAAQGAIASAFLVGHCVGRPIPAPGEPPGSGRLGDHEVKDHHQRGKGRNAKRSP